jgi:hypothetical protein
MYNEKNQLFLLFSLLFATANIFAQGAKTEMEKAQNQVNPFI